MKAYSILGLIVLCLGFGWYQSHLSTKLAEQDALAQKTLAESVSKQLTEAKDEASRVNILLKTYQNVKQEVQIVDRIVTKEVIRYRDVVHDRCQLDGMWVNTYNLSTLYSTGSPARVDGAAFEYGIDQTFDAANVLEITTFNNRQCVADQQRLLALQQWAKRF